MMPVRRGSPPRGAGRWLDAFGPSTLRCKYATVFAGRTATLIDSGGSPATFAEACHLCHYRDVSRRRYIDRVLAMYSLGLVAVGMAGRHGRRGAVLAKGRANFAIGAAKSSPRARPLGKSGRSGAQNSRVCALEPTLGR